MSARNCRGVTTAVHCHGKEYGGEGDDGGFTICWFLGERVAVAWLCMRAICPATTILEVLSLVPGHQKSRKCIECGSGSPSQAAPMAQGGVLDRWRARWARPDEEGGGGVGGEWGGGLGGE